MARFRADIDASVRDAFLWGDETVNLDWPAERTRRLVSTSLETALSQSSEVEEVVKLFWQFPDAYLGPI